MNRRGMVRAHSHWRPTRRSGVASGRVAPLSWRRSRGRVRAMLVAATIAGLALAVVVIRGSTTGSVVLPATPTAWLDAFSAGVARDSGDVCGRLLWRSSGQRWSGMPTSLALRTTRVLRCSRFACCGSCAWARQPRSRSGTSRGAGTRRSCSTGRRPAGKRSRLCRAARCRSPDAAGPVKSQAYRAAASPAGFGRLILVRVAFSDQTS